MSKLYIIMPAYNEKDNIENVAREWHDIVAKIGPDCRLAIFDDGSKDATYAILQRLEQELPQLVAITKANSGHGATLLQGYRYALAHGADYIFQTDSDGQTIPEEFWPFWEQREKYSVIIGYRNNRQDGVSRKFVTKVLKIVLFMSFGVKIIDANTPFRLMSQKALATHIQKVPENFNLSNVMLTVCFVKYKENMQFIPITFRPRQGGKNSINLRRIFVIGRQAVKDFKKINQTLY